MLVRYSKGENSYLVTMTRGLVKLAMKNGYDTYLMHHSVP